MVGRMSKKVSRGGSSVKEVKPVVSTGGKVDVAKKSSSRVVTPSVKVSSGVVVESVVTSARSSGKPASVNTGKSGSGSGSVSGSVKKAVESAVTSSVGSGVAVGKSSSASVGVVGSGAVSYTHLTLPTIA